MMNESTSGEFQVYQRPLDHDDSRVVCSPLPIGFGIDQMLQCQLYKFVKNYLIKNKVFQTLEYGTSIPTIYQK